MKLHLIWHLLRKDIRYQQAAVLFLVVMAIYVAVINASASEYTEVISVLSGCAFEFLTVLVFIQVVVLDPPGRLLQFLGSRPIPPLSILASKLLFTVLFIILPTIACQLLTIYLTGIPITLAEELFASVQTGMFMAVFLATFGFLALYFRGVISVLLAYLVYYLIIAVAMEAVVLVSQVDLGRQVGNPYGAACYLLYYLALGGASIIRYQSKTIILPVLIFVATLVITESIALWNMVESHPDNPTPVVASELSGVQVIFPPGDINASIKYEKDKAMTYLSIPVSFSGINPPFYVSPVLTDRSIDFSSQAMLPSGSQVDDRAQHQSVIPDVSAEAVPEPVMADMVHIFHPRIEPLSATTRLFAFRNTDLKPQEDTAPNLSGSFTVGLDRAQIYPFIMKVRSGEVAFYKRSRFAIQNVSRTGNTESFDVVIDSVSIDGETESDDGPGPRSCIVFNRAENSSIQADISTGANWWFLLHKRFIHISFSVLAVNASQWEDGAEVAFFNISPAIATVPFRLEKVNLRPDFP